MAVPKGKRTERLVGKKLGDPETFSLNVRNGANKMRELTQKESAGIT
jgi:hypothetical protein